MTTLQTQSQMVDKQGQQANLNGKNLENMVEEFIESCGIPAYQYSKLMQLMYKDTSNFIFEVPDILVKNVPYINMYGGKSRGEFVLRLKNKPPIRIECRSQEVSGSVDEKLPYLFGNCMSFEEKDVILIIEGSGMRPEAKKYIDTVTKRSLPLGKSIKVMSFNAFKKWLANVLVTQN